MNILINECFDHYKNLLFENKDILSSADQIPIFHKASKNDALIKFKEAKKMGSKDHHRKFEKVLNLNFENFYEQWKNQSEEGIK